jgi:hypothetical protein
VSFSLEMREMRVESCFETDLPKWLERISGMEIYMQANTNATTGIISGIFSLNETLFKCFFKNKSRCYKTFFFRNLQMFVIS